LVSFRGESADVALRPTGSVEVARARLAELPTGGRTPLAEGVQAALDVALAAGSAGGSSGRRPVIVVVSDGRANAGPPGANPLEAAWEAGAAIRARGIAAVVVDAETGRARLGLASKLAGAMGADLVHLDDLSAGSLAGALRDAIRR
jgi:magnesium chelatase subunit D